MTGPHTRESTIFGAKPKRKGRKRSGSVRIKVRLHYGRERKRIPTNVNFLIKIYQRIRVNVKPNENKRLFLSFVGLRR